jgi:RNA polymerase sigma factor for flagellar operon FliA
MGFSREVGSEALLPTALAVLEDILRFLRARHRLSVEEAEDLGSLFRIKLLDHDHAVLRAYRGESNLRTYLGVVAQRLFLDYRASQWGKWRPSSAARRLGPLAIELEGLVHRDQRTATDAVELMAARHAGEVSRVMIEDLAEKLSLPPSGRLDASLQGRESATGAGDSTLEGLERGEVARKVASTLESTLIQLSIEDRLILKMHYQDGLTLAAVARALDLDQKRLYRRLGGILKAFRSELEDAGVRGPDVAELLGRPDVDLSFRIEPGEATEKSTPRPSMEASSEDGTGRS